MFATWVQVHQIPWSWSSRGLLSSIRGMGAKNLTLALWKITKCSYLQSHLSTTWVYIFFIHTWSKGILIYLLVTMNCAARTFGWFCVEMHFLLSCVYTEYWKCQVNVITLFFSPHFRIYQTLFQRGWGHACFAFLFSVFGIVSAWQEVSHSGFDLHQSDR